MRLASGRGMLPATSCAPTPDLPNCTSLDRRQAAEGMASDAFFVPIHPADKMRIRIAVAGVMHGADLFNKQFRVQVPNGTFRWVSAQGSAERDADNRVISFNGLLTDITEQKRVEERLRVAQSAGGVGTFEYVSGFGTVDVSEQFCRLLGLTPTDSVALRAINAVLPEGCAPLIGGANDFVERRTALSRGARSLDPTRARAAGSLAAASGAWTRRMAAHG